MSDWKDCKDSGSWAFIPQENKYGYLNNALWSSQQDAIDFCEDQDLELDLPNQHLPCGHFHKEEMSEDPFPAGKWVAAMQQPGTPYIYVYDILQKAVIRIDTSEIPVFVSGRLELDSAYALDYDMGYGNPGAQRGAYCMNKDGTRIWYLFTKSDGNRSDAELIEVDISKTDMLKVKSTLFPNLVPSEASPGANERINDGCSDDTYTYWCTNLIAGRIIKIQNSNHSIIDDHTFNYPIEGCTGGSFDEAIAIIDVNKSTGKLYWVYVRDHLSCVPPYNACRHLIRSDTELIQEIDDMVCGTGSSSSGWQNLIRVYSSYILHSQAYHPSLGFLMKRGLDCIELDEVTGTNGERYACIKSHFAAVANRPVSGGDYATYWTRSAESGGDVWSGGQSYTCSRISQDYIQNILGVQNNKIFTLMYVNSVSHPGYLYCINFSDMNEISKLDVSYYAGQAPSPTPWDWDWTSVSAMNYQTGVIAIFRYHNVQKRNYAGCFDASPSLGFLCDVPLYSIKHGSSPAMSAEPQSWPLEGFTPPEIPETPSPIEVISDPGPGEVIYEPSYPPDDAPDQVPILQDGFLDHTVSIGPGQTLFFQFEASIPDCDHPIQISSTPGKVPGSLTGQCSFYFPNMHPEHCATCGPCPDGEGKCYDNSQCRSGYCDLVTHTCQQPPTVHLLVKKGSRPTIAEFEQTWLKTPSIYDCGLGQWVPLKSGVEDLYWNYNMCYHQAETIKISEPMGSNTFYIMLYNDGKQKVYNQRLTVSYN